MGKAKITITGVPTKEPKIKTDGTVDLLIKVDMSPAVPKGLESLGASLCLVHVGKKTWKKVGGVATKDSFYIVQGEAKANVSKKNTPFMEIIAFDISLRDAMPPKESKEPKKQEKKEVKQKETEKEQQIKVSQTVAKDKPDKKETDKKNNKGFNKRKKPYVTIQEWFEEDEIITINTSDVIVDDSTHVLTNGFTFGREFLKKIHESRTITRPVAIRPIENAKGKYSLVMGLRYLMAAKMFNLDTVPAVIKDMTYKEFEKKYINFQDRETVEKQKNKN